MKIKETRDGGNTISTVVRDAVQTHLDVLADSNKEPTGVYRQVLDTVEPAMLEVIMRHTGGNQSKAAQFMGINRATLRTKLKRHSLDNRFWG